MRRIELTETFQIEKTPLISMVYTKLFQRFKLRRRLNADTTYEMLAQL